MANAVKNKGDRAEREAVAFLLDTCRDLCLPKAKRMLGAGRAEDVGDLYVFPDVAVQVRSYTLSNIGTAVRSSAADSVTQAANGDMPFGLGLVPYPRARVGSVRWIAATTPQAWPGGSPTDTVPFKMISRALGWVRDDEGPHGYMVYLRERRIGLVDGGNASEPLLVAPFEAWLSAYREATRRPDPNEIPVPRLFDASSPRRSVVIDDLPDPHTDLSA